MQTPGKPGERIGTTGLQHLGGNVAGRIVSSLPQDKQRWLEIVRAFRSERDWQLLYQHRARMSAYLENVVEFRRG